MAQHPRCLTHPAGLPPLRPEKWCFQAGWIRACQGHRAFEWAVLAFGALLGWPFCALQTSEERLILFRPCFCASLAVVVSGIARLPCCLVLHRLHPADDTFPPGDDQTARMVLVHQRLSLCPVEHIQPAFTSIWKGNHSGRKRWCKSSYPPHRHVQYSAIASIFH